MRPDSRRGFRGDLWRVARLLPRRGQGHAARQCDLRTAILAARGNFANFAACVAVVMLLCSDDLCIESLPKGLPLDWSFSDICSLRSWGLDRWQWLLKARECRREHLFEICDRLWGV